MGVLGGEDLEIPNKLRAGASSSGRRKADQPLANGQCRGVGHSPSEERPPLDDPSSAQDSLLSEESVIWRERPTRSVEDGGDTTADDDDEDDDGEQGWESTMSLLEEMHSRGVIPNVDSYNAAIQACGQDGRWEHALGLLRKMRWLDLAPNLETYNTVILACSRGGQQWERIVRLLEEMRGKGLEPDAFSYGTAVGACATNDQWALALRLLAEMRAIGAQVAPTDYEVVLSACERASGRAKADLLRSRLRQMDEVNVKGGAKCERDGPVEG